MTPVLVLTCEHAVDHLPAAIAAAVVPHTKRGTHWSHDIGALAVARTLARQLDAPLVSGKISRLLVDLNRSPHHPKVLSAYAHRLPSEERGRLMERYHHAHWSAVARMFERALAQGRPIFHVAVHSFTPVWRGAGGPATKRTADVGLLYDPRRNSERTWADAWHAVLAELAPAWRVRRNYPYLGRADGLATATRKRLPANRYVGFELELNQALLARPIPVARTLAATLRVLLAGK